MKIVAKECEILYRYTSSSFVCVCFPASFPTSFALLFPIPTNNTTFFFFYRSRILFPKPASYASQTDLPANSPSYSPSSGNLITSSPSPHLLFFSLFVLVLVLVRVTPDFLTSSFTCFCCCCISGLLVSNFTERLTTTAQSAYKAPGTKTSSGISNNNDAVLLEVPPSTLDVEVAAEGVELDLEAVVVDIEAEVASDDDESNLKGVGRNKTCKMDCIAAVGDLVNTRRKGCEMRYL